MGVVKRAVKTNDKKRKLQFQAKNAIKTTKRR
jgi:hypothetical protein